ncbi:MAG TPA: hypothetical protein PKK10_16240, partial [Woeseiaceae bacterium]|nr:hypothetical protein [Woeseiaceae bacterium]
AHAKARFDAGDIALTELLAEERVLRDAEGAYARTHSATAVDLVALFKALGGGWDARASGGSLSDARGPATGLWQMTVEHGGQAGA